MDYKDLLDFLFQNQDLKYRNFHLKILGCDENIIGVRTPILKKLAKDLSKLDLNFIDTWKFEYYEEKVLYGLIISYKKMSFEEILQYLDKFMVYNTNWAINDIVCSSLKKFLNYKDEGFNYIKKCVQSKNSWEVRFGLVLLLNYYVNDKYIDKVINIISSITKDEYYVKMANAWLISICYIKYKEKTMLLFKNSILDTFTNNKAISKIKDSYRVSEFDKKVLDKYKK